MQIATIIMYAEVAYLRRRLSAVAEEPDIDDPVSYFSPPPLISDEGEPPQPTAGSRGMSGKNKKKY